MLSSKYLKEPRATSTFLLRRYIDFSSLIFSRPSTSLRGLFRGNNGTRRVTAVETPGRYYPETFSNQALSSLILHEHLSSRSLSLLAFQPTLATVDGLTPRARNSWSPPRWRAEQRGRTARATIERSPTETAVDCASCTKRAAELSVWLLVP